MSSAAPLSNLISTTTATSHRLVATVPTEAESALTALEKSLFVRASELLARVTVAAKDENGRICWVTLEPAYHSVLVKTAVAAVKASGPSHCVASIKEALFTFLLAILNGRPQDKFLASKEVESKTNRANRERKRLARKRSRAAKRERDREAKHLQNTTRMTEEDRSRSKPSGSTRTCMLCEKKFASRKKLSRHSCSTTQANEALPTKQPGIITDAKRARRARARKARREAVKAKKVAEQEAQAILSAAAKKLKLRTPVTDTSGKTITCENCDSPAVGAVHHGNQRYEKCEDCGTRRTDFIWFRECDTCPGSPV
ncbi:hypothetical protein BKA70DRAFT_560664 [Coprinopsis sp. MPI-PUGE-AT-0042]|nr:hypothetical protein BKA70DRAFT_560664 [Coprinopsis sp. MPI-PUGE-AT-0042]